MNTEVKTDEDVCARPYMPEDLAKIADVIGKKSLHPYWVEQLQQRAKAYEQAVWYESTIPTRKERRAALLKLADVARCGTDESLEQMFEDPECNLDYLAVKNLPDLKQRSALADAAEQEAQLQGRGGRPMSRARRPFVDFLAYMYFRLTNARPTRVVDGKLDKKWRERGVFYDFCNACLESIDRSATQGLAKEVRVVARRFRHRAKYQRPSGMK